MKHALLISLVLLGGASLSGGVVPFALFRDGLVIPRGKPVPVWGKADPGEQVVVAFKGASVSGKADAQGRWRILLPVFAADATSAVMTIRGATNAVAVADVVVGDVFLAGGQSNMEVPVKEALNPGEEIAAANHPLIREFRVGHDFDFVERDDVRGRWKRVTPETAAETGAVGYYFARRLRETLDIPVGIVNNSYSGSPIQAWVDLEYLRSTNLFAAVTKAFDQMAALGRDGVLRRREELGALITQHTPESFGELLKWHLPAIDDSRWKTCQVPAFLEGVYGEVDGLFWYRKAFDLPAGLAGKPLTFRLGVVDDGDAAYFNGGKIGSTSPDDVPDSWDFKRVYNVPGSLVKAGRNVVAVRCYDSGHAGGLAGPEIRLEAEDGTVVDLAGIWKINWEQMLQPRPWPSDYLPLVKIYHQGAVLYHAMCAPLRGFPFTAILWYQGESDADRPGRYVPLFRHLITRWRADFGDPALPFLYVQLAAFGPPDAEPDEQSPWANLRAAQDAALALPRVFVAPAIDIGDAGRIHPLNKQEVGRRLALTMLQDVYHLEQDVIRYPVFDSAVRDGSKVVLAFRGADGLRTTDGRAPRAFALANAAPGAKLVWADAVLDGNRIVLSAPGIGRPARVRYAWSQNPGVNVVNALGFPLLPFRADLAD